MSVTPSSAALNAGRSARATPRRAAARADALLAELRGQAPVQNLTVLAECEQLLIPRLESLAVDDQVRVLQACASGCQAAGRWLDGLRYAQDAIARISERQEADLIPLLAISGNLFRALGHAPLAALSYERALRIARRAGLTQDAARILVSLGPVYTDVNAPDRSLEAYEECLSLCEAHDLARIRPQALNNLASQHVRLGDHERALALVESAIADCQRVPGADYPLPFCLHTQGTALRQAGRLDAAIDAFDRALALLEARPSIPLELRLLIDRGATLDQAGRGDEAIAPLERAARIAREHAAHRLLAEATLTLASVHQRAGRSEAALQAMADHLAAQEDALHLEREGARLALEVLERTEVALDQARRDALNVESLTLRLIDTQAKASRLAAAAATDPVTGGLNRKILLERLSVLCQADGAHPFSILMIDCDDLRDINTRFGPIGGDQVLRNLALAVGRILRVSDSFGRYGGDEFMVIAPNTGPGAAAIVAERIIETVATLPVTIGDAQIQISVSIGIACVPAGTPVSVETCVRRAERALARAQTQGKSRFAVARISAESAESAEGSENADSAEPGDRA